MTTETEAEEDNGPIGHQFFYEDLVFKIKDKKVCFGMVVDNYEDDSDSEPNDECSPPLSKGSVRVAWYPHGWDQVIRERSVELADRSLMPGDVVRRLKPPSRQHGYCRRIDVSVAVQVAGTKWVSPAVANARLKALDNFPLDLVACLDSWVGSIKEHHINLKLVSNDCPSAVVEIAHNSSCALKVADKRNMRRWPSSFECEHYVGQTLVVKPSELKQATWISGSRDLQQSRRRHRFTVESMETVAVGVYWQCQGLSLSAYQCQSRTSHTPPEYLVTGDNLKRLKVLNVFDTCTSQMGDRNFIEIQESDVFEQKSKWMHRLSRIFRGVKERTEVETRNDGDRVTCEITLEAPIDNVSTDDDEDWSTDDESDSSSVTNSCSSSSAAPKGGATLGHHHHHHHHGKKSPVLVTKVLKKKLKKVSRPVTKPPANEPPPKPGSIILVDTLCTSSVATVVWQDGTVEENIPSTALLPIHHLDEQEFFPGDFVIRAGGQVDLRDYGLVQRMEHAGRTALVKWFRTYAAPVGNSGELQNAPSQHGLTEMSVYDLKDHPDFNFRPGTVVIRVAGGDDSSSVGACLAGQVLDNYPEGRISVRWVNGEQSMCWPQDLYRVGDYDSDEGELWDSESVSGGSGGNDSWETQSEESLPGDPSDELALRPRLAANIERSCDAMARLEEMFSQNPALQSRDVMRKLLEVYKDCRYLDKLMGTSIFHEQHFTALLERVRNKEGRSPPTNRIQRHVARLFSAEGLPPDSESTTVMYATITSGPPNSKTECSIQPTQNLETPVLSKEDPIAHSSPPQNRDSLISMGKFVDDALNSSLESNVTPLAKTNEILNNIINAQQLQIDNDQSKNSTDTSDTEQIQLNCTAQNISSTKEDAGKLSVSARRGLPDMNRVSSESDPTSTQNDSGVFSSQHTLDSADSEFADVENKTVYSANTSQSAPIQDSSSFNMPATCSCYLGTSGANACKELCALIKSRLVIAHAEVTRRLGTHEFMHTLTTVDDEDDDKPIVKDSVSTNTTEKIDETPSEVNQPTAQIDSTSLGEGFQMLDHAPATHKYHLSLIQPSEKQLWLRAVRREHRLLSRALPPGCWVRAYEDRLDILSVMVRGPVATPYEGGLFLFDVQLPANYPFSPPLFHYISFCSDRLNPNLYEDGKVCVSLLGTWAGRGTEVWGSTSTLLQVIVSIQGLILNSEPYYNEAGYERQRGSTLGQENSRMYNEMVILKLVQSMTKLLQQSPEIFCEEIIDHFKRHARSFCDRLEGLLQLSSDQTDKKNMMECASGALKSDAEMKPDTDLQSKKQLTEQKFMECVRSELENVKVQVENAKQQFEDILMTDKSTSNIVQSDVNKNPKVPEFPLVPASRGFCLSLKSALPAYVEVAKRLELLDDNSKLES